jgi:thiol-disulfide isomerase/thioredoxin
MDDDPLRCFEREITMRTFLGPCAGLAMLVLLPVSSPVFATHDRPAAAEKESAKAGAPGPDDLLTQAIDAIKDDNLPKAVQKLEQVLKIEPQNREALVLLSRIKERQAMELARPENSPLFLEAAQLARRALAVPKAASKPEKAFFASVLYNEACTYAIDKQPEKAMASLSEASKLGFAELDTIETDAELDSLRKRADFQKLQKEIEARAIPIAREHARELLSQNKPFPFSFELPGLSGKRVSLADFQGKITIVDVWGTWCPPCRMEIPHFIKLYKRYHDRGLEIVGINYERAADDAKAKEMVREFVTKQGIPYRCVIGDEKTQEQIPMFEGYPTTLFLGRDGAVRLKVVGYHSFLDLDAIVSNLLEERTATP